MNSVSNDKLAIEGGSKAKNSPYGSGKRFGENELNHLREALEQNTLFYYKGKKVKEFTARFSSMYGFNHCIATSSGTASLHVALSSIGVTVGDEVIVPPLTDMGTVIGILFQNAIPVFADINPDNYKLDPVSVEKAITPRTKAIIAVHLMGGACDMDALLDIAKKHDIALIEDCAQAFGTRYKNRNVGSMGIYGCFSTNDFKHISTGDGGLIVTSDAERARIATEVSDKNYCRTGNTLGRSAKFLAPNYRMTELQGAVGLAQLERLEHICSTRHRLGMKLCSLLEGIPGVAPYKPNDGSYTTFFGFTGRIKTDEIKVGRAEFLAALSAEGVPAGPYIPEPIYNIDMFQNRSIYKGTTFPLEGTGKSYHYEKGMCPVAEEVINSMFLMPLNEFYTDNDIEETATAFRKVGKFYAR
ncbi:MAG: DegT/DnrJ/EryC1/StrS family aminotransferase [Fibrobacteres bacterium]|nr:DegT/DnrJ/EryC1/StrS family aminotransferase [Fibrobacterota bacterium]